MTDEQIIKALEYCVEQGITSECERCELQRGCRTEMIATALELIIRQKAEIEELREIVFTDRSEAIKKLKSEAIKDFAERVKEKTLAMIWSPELFSTDDYIECIDSIVKETVGE